MTSDQHPDDDLPSDPFGNEVFGADPFATASTATPAPPVRPPADDRRRLDLFSGIAGVTVLVIAGLFAVLDLDALDEQARLIGPIGLVGLGLALLATTLERRA